MPAFYPQRLVPALEAFPAASRCWIAYSGGLDSEALLQATASLRGRLRPELRAIHVDHGLHPSSAAWAEHCRRRCARLGVPLTLRRLSLGRVRGESLEALAREARYAAMGEAVGADDLLLTAQHRDDQAETLLLALMRGSGIKGLAAMPEVARFGESWLLRPLLLYSRRDLLDYALGEGLVWVDDPSNADLSFDRNFLRARVLPLLAERWPGCATRLARTAAHCAEAQGLVDGVAQRALEPVQGLRPGTLSVSRLLETEYALVKAVLRHWIGGLGLPAPDSRHLARIYEEVLGARADRSPLVAWSGCEVRRYRDDLFAMPPLPGPPGPLDLTWDRGPLSLPSGLGRLLLTDAEGGTLNPISLWRKGLRVRFAVEGLTCRPNGAARHRRLKHLFQEAGVPPWLRGYVPYLFAGGSLVAVGDLWRCFGTPSDDAPPWRVDWDRGIRTHPGFTLDRAVSR